MPKRDRGDSDLSDSSDEQRNYAKQVALAEFQAERSSKKLKDEMNEFNKAENAKRRAKGVQIKNEEKAKLYARELKAKERAKKEKKEREKAQGEALKQRPFGFTRAMRSYSDKSDTSKDSVSSLDSQVFILFLL